MRRLGVLVVHFFAAPPAEHVDDRAGGRDRHGDVSRDLLGGHLRPQIPLSEALLEESIAPRPRVEVVPVLFPIVMFVLPSNVRVHKGPRRPRARPGGVGGSLACLGLVSVGDLPAGNFQQLPVGLFPVPFGTNSRHDLAAAPPHRNNSRHAS